MPDSGMHFNCDTILAIQSLSEMQLNDIITENAGIYGEKF